MDGLIIVEDLPECMNCDGKKTGRGLVSGRAKRSTTPANLASTIQGDGTNVSGGTAGEAGGKAGGGDGCASASVRCLIDYVSHEERLPLRIAQHIQMVVLTS